MTIHEYVKNGKLTAVKELLQRNAKATQHKEVCSEYLFIFNLFSTRYPYLLVNNHSICVYIRHPLSSHHILSLRFVTSVLCDTILSFFSFFIP